MGQRRDANLSDSLFETDAGISLLDKELLICDTVENIYI